jgi:hypothetical protein
VAEGNQVAVVDDRLDELLRTVDSMRSFVRYRLWGRPNDVDVVLQIVRESVWRRCSAYDPAKGTPNAFVFGITRHVVLRELQRKVVETDELPADIQSGRDVDPLDALIGRFEANRWMSLVADFVGPSDWVVVGELGLTDGDGDRVADTHHLSARGLRTVRERVSQAAHTVRAALAAADAGLPLTGSVVVRCVPERGGFRAVAEMIDDDADTIAARLHIHAGSARARIATAKRLMMIARAVLEQEVSA